MRLLGRLPAGFGVRTLSSVAVVLVAAAVVYGPRPLLTLLVLAMAGLGLMEVYDLLAREGERPPLALGLALVWGLVLAAAPASRTPPLLGLAVFAGLAVPLLRGLAVGPRPGGLQVWLSTSGGVLYVGWPLAHLELLRALPGGAGWLVLVVACTWATDTGAYLVGASVGRRKLAPSVSPGKTVEGAFGALALTTPVGVLVGAAVGLPLGVGALAALALGLSFVAQVGDLTESYIKRLAGAKDSGKLLPGHGGLLDRIDGLMWAAVAAYYIALGVL
jgi:phosphatidate cytidylyltransferase